MRPFRVYVSADCAVCARTHQLLAELRERRPAFSVELVDLDQPDALRPAFVFGTPTYVLGERVISLGNPALADLIALLDAEAARALAPGAAPDTG
jgi:hypothetical protein